MHLTNYRGVATRCISLALATTMLFPPSTGLIAAAFADAAKTAMPAAVPAAAAQTSSSTNSILLRSVLIFPTSNDGGAPVDAANLTTALDAAIKLRLLALSRIKTTFYSPHLASVTRAVSDRVLSTEDLTPPFNDTTKSAHIAQQVATEGFLTTTIESFTSDPTAKTAAVEVSVGLYDTTTGSTLKSIVVTGKGVALTPSSDQTAVNQYAIDDAASGIVHSLNVQTPPMAPIVISQSQVGSASHDSGKTALLVLLGGAVLYALLHHGSDGGSSTTSPTSGTGNGGGGGTTQSGPPAPPTL